MFSCKGPTYVVQAGLQGTSSGRLHANGFPCKGTPAENPPTASDNKAINEAADPAAEPPWAGGFTPSTSG